MRFMDRDVCRVLEDMTNCYETRNFSMLPGLIAEAKILASRIENLVEMADSQERLMASIDRLEKKRNKLRDEVGPNDE